MLLSCIIIPKLQTDDSVTRKEEKRELAPVQLTPCLASIYSENCVMWKIMDLISPPVNSSKAFSGFLPE